MNRGAKFALLTASAIMIVAGAVGMWREAGETRLLRAELQRAQSRTNDLRELRAQNQSLRAEMLPTTEVEKLRAEHAAIARLRREIDGLQQQIAATRAANDMAQRSASQSARSGPTNSSSLSPAARPLLPTVESRYASLIAGLHFTPAQAGRFKELLVARLQAERDAVSRAVQQGRDPNTMHVRQEAGTGMGKVEQQIRAEFGHAVFSSFQEFEWTFAAQTIVTALENMLKSTPTPLSRDQATRLVPILARARGNASDVAPVYRIRITDETMRSASGILSPPQLQVLKGFQERSADSGSL